MGTGAKVWSQGPGLGVISDLGLLRRSRPGSTLLMTSRDACRRNLTRIVRCLRSSAEPICICRRLDRICIRLIIILSPFGS